MDMSYVSAHAKVLEGVRSARMRAYAEAQLPEGEHHEQCVYALGESDDTYCDGAAVVLWVQGPAGAIHPLCKRHLDSWASDHYTPGEWQPPVFVPLLHRWH